jgi:choline dehydrogenase-like flavoprotein
LPIPWNVPNRFVARVAIGRMNAATIRDRPCRLGRRDWNPLIHIPAGFFKMLDHDTLTWKFRAEPDPGTNGRAIVYTRGRVIGGSSSINGLIYIRGQPEDYDHWAQLGNRGWSWDDCLPYFRKPSAGRARAATPAARRGRSLRRGPTGRRSVRR